jgi:hypothetical protein
MPVIETGPDEWRSPARPSSYTRGSIFRKSGRRFSARKCDNQKSKLQKSKLQKSKLVGSGRNRTACPKGPRLQRGDGTSLSLPALPDRFIHLVAGIGVEPTLNSL